MDMDLYSYLIAAHVTAVVFFVGGLLAHDRMISAAARLPLDQQAGILAALFRLDRHVTSPALLLTWMMGLSLAMWAGWFPAAWLMVKLVFVVGLSALHGMQSGRLRRLIRDGKPAAAIPGAGVVIVLAMLAIAVLALVKPI